MNKRLGVLLGAALAGSLSCSNDRDILRPPPEPPPQPGWLTVALTSPRADDGGIVFEIRGRAVPPPVLSDTTMFIYSERMDSTITRVVVVGPLTTGPLVYFEVFDIHQPYSATIVQVSDRTNLVRTYLQDYKLEVSAYVPPP